MRILFGVDVGFDKDNNPLGDVEGKIAEARLCACNTFGGCSITRVEGAWANPAGGIVIEPGIAITVYVNTKQTPARIKARNDAQTFARYLRTTFNQSSIMLSTSECDVEFIED